MSTLICRSQGMTRRPTVSRDDRVFSLSSHNSPAMSLPMDDDVRSVAYGLLIGHHLDQGIVLPHTRLNGVTRKNLSMEKMIMSSYVFYM